MIDLNIQSGEKFHFVPSNVTIDEVYRNYYTIINHQNLLDDLVEDERDQDNIHSAINATSEILKDNNFVSRPFRYAQANPVIAREDFLRPFIRNKAGQFGIGRYGDGFGYGVFYAALEAETTIRECIYHAHNDFLARRDRMDEENYIQDRKLIRVGFKGSCIDLLSLETIRPELTGSSYELCQRLGRLCVEKRIDALKVPSARSDGTCFPIFNESSITGFDPHKSFIYNFQIVISKKDPTKIRVDKLVSSDFYLA